MERAPTHWSNTGDISRMSAFLESTCKRKVIILLLQTTVILISFITACLLRFDLQVPQNITAVALGFLLPLLAAKLLVFWWMGLFAGWWRYISLPDLLVVFQANALGSLAFALLLVLLQQGRQLPPSVLIIDGILCFVLLGGVRVVARLVREQLEKRRKGHSNAQQRVLIVGAGGVGQSFVREIRQNPRLNMHITGFVDSDSNRQRQRFQGVPVLGSPTQLGRILRNHAIDLVVVAEAAMDRRVIQEVVEVCKQEQVSSKIIPPVSNFLSGDISVRQVRDIQVEDLLGRKPVRLEIAEIENYLQDKFIMVTGAGGSIGSEICRQVAGFRPRGMILLDHAETPLFNIEQELRDKFPSLLQLPCLGDIRDRPGLEAQFAAYRPEVVFHAAAYKHVPMSEVNPNEAVRNNVFGTIHVADLCNAWGVETLVMISTDKAVNPTSAMGASKRAAEIYVQSLARSSSSRMVTVRFGNVLGSNGSVVNIFKKQIEKGGPVTVTDPQMTRFFMTIPEAVQLVLQAGSMGRGGEIFLLDMGEPVTIVHLAEEMIRLSGLRPGRDIDIVFTGLRPGEKLHEELLLAAEGIQPTAHEKIKVVEAVFFPPEQLKRQLENLSQAVSKRDLPAMLRALQTIVPEYRGGKVVAHPVPLATGLRALPSIRKGTRPLPQVLQPELS
jgi:FlaA1/EpsC-like NDP-sugar epimerase